MDRRSAKLFSGTRHIGLLVAAISLAPMLIVPVNADPTNTSISYSPSTSLDESTALTPTALTIGRASSLNLTYQPGSTLLPLYLSQTALLHDGRESPNLGVGFIYFTPGAKTDLAGNPSSTNAPVAYGFADNLQLLSPTGSNTDDGLKLQGQFFLSSGDPSTGMTEKPPLSQEAFSQTVSYGAPDLNITASVLNVGKNFQGGSGVADALKSSNPAGADSAQSMLSRLGQNSTSIALGVGNSSSGVLGFKIVNSADSIAASNSGDRKLSFDRMFAAGVGLSVSDDQSNVSSNGSNLITHTQYFKLASDVSGSHLGFDLEDKIHTDNQGNTDRKFCLGAAKNVAGYTLGITYGLENARSANQSQADIRTVQYTASRAISPTTTVAANWTTTTNSAQTSSQHQQGEGTASVSVAPLRRLTVKSQYTSKSGNSSRKVNAVYLMPRMMGLSNASLNLSVSTNGGTSASVSNRKLALDATTPGQQAALLRMFSSMSVHLEDNQTIQTASVLSPGTPGSSYMIGLDSSPSDFKAFKWNYKMIQAQVAGAQSDTTAQALDLSVPVGTVTLGYSSKDQIPQSDGTFADTKQQEIKLATALPDGNMSLATNYSAAVDYHDSICHRNTVGLTLSGATGTNQRLNFGLALQSSTVDGSDSNTATSYTFGYHFHRDSQNSLDLDSTVTTHQATSTTTTAATTANPIDSTVQMSYKHAF